MNRQRRPLLAGLDSTWAVVSGSRSSASAAGHSAFWAYSGDSSPCLHGSAGRWVIVVLGILLYITPLPVPFVFGGAATATVTYTAYVMGLLIAAAGLYLLAKPAKVIGEWIQVHWAGRSLLARLFLAFPSWSLWPTPPGSLVFSRSCSPAP